MQPQYGCRLHDLVFEPMDPETEAAIELAISRAILFHEPRITLERVLVRTEDWTEGRLTILLEYRVPRDQHAQQRGLPVLSRRRHPPLRDARG